MITPAMIMYAPLVRAALREDFGQLGDLTTDAIADPGQRAELSLVAREQGVVAGLDVAQLSFQLLDAETVFTALVRDGDVVQPGQRIADIHATVGALLSGERTALNFLCRLSGIATATARLVAAVQDYPAQVACTRKTTPGLRLLEKYAVRVGGGQNHRASLADAALIKDNHIAIAGGIEQAISRVRAHVGHMVRIEIEVDSLDQLSQVMDHDVDAVLLDNMTPSLLQEAVAFINGRALAEASGRVNLDTIVPIAASGVDVISVGWLTHSAPILDLGLDAL